ncbi:MAG: hypothetical protein AB7U75_04250 [Hyphomicrobiaceae bacterium]
MLTRILAALLAAIVALPIIASDADARPKKKRTYSSGTTSTIGHYGKHGYVMEPRKRKQGTRSARSAYRSDERMSLGYSSYASSSRYGAGPRPGKWCGWWMRTQRGGGPEYNVAWNWRNYGRPASPQVGAVVVWRHHVGQIVGQAANGRWLVQSGNDGGAVRTRARSISGAVIRM